MEVEGRICMLAEIFGVVRTAFGFLSRKVRKITINASREEVEIGESALIYGYAKGHLGAPVRNRYLFAFVDGKAVDGVRTDDAGGFVYSRRLGQGTHTVFFADNPSGL